MKQPSLSDLEDHLGYWLRFVSNQVSHAFSVKLAARDVTVAEWVMLRSLFDVEALVPSVLAERLGMTRGAISKLADRLGEKGLVGRTASKDDLRSHSLALTPAGRALLPELSGLADANDAEFFGHLAPAERMLIETAMKDIVRAKGLRIIPIK